MYTVKNEYSHFGASIPTIHLRQFKGRYSNCILPIYSSRSSTLYAVRPQGKVINEAQFGKEVSYMLFVAYAVSHITLSSSFPIILI